MKKLCVLGLLLVAGWCFYHEPAAHWRGMPAAPGPVQHNAPLPAAFFHAGYTITPLATYRISAVVLSRSRYRYDRSASLSPLDLALGWGPMSIASVINDLHISQSGRWYEYSWRNDPPLEPSAIATHSANTHCLPADASVQQALLAIKRHDLVSLEGYLVEVRGPDEFLWRSSLSRDDTGGKACEVMWVTAVTRRSL